MQNFISYFIFVSSKLSSLSSKYWNGEKEISIIVKMEREIYMKNMCGLFQSTKTVFPEIKFDELCIML